MKAERESSRTTARNVRDDTTGGCEERLGTAAAGVSGCRSCCASKGRASVGRTFLSANLRRHPPRSLAGSRRAFRAHTHTLLAHSLTHSLRRRSSSDRGNRLCSHSPRNDCARGGGSSSSVQRTLIYYYTECDSMRSSLSAHEAHTLSRHTRQDANIHIDASPVQPFAS